MAVFRQNPPKGTGLSVNPGSTERDGVLRAVPRLPIAVAISSRAWALRSVLLPRSPSCSLAASSFLLPDCVHRAVCPSYCDCPRPLCRVRPPLGDASRVALDLGRVWPRVAFDPASRPVALRPPPIVLRLLAPPPPPPSPCRMFRAKPCALLDNLCRRTTIPN